MIPERSTSNARSGAQRGASWLLGLLEAEGSFRGAAALDCYYKGPCALAFSGYRSEAVRVLDFTRRKFLRPNGDLDGSGVAWYDRFRTYPHSWLLWAATELGDEELSRQLSGFLEQRWNAESGGFRADADGTEEIMTTSLAGLAMLRAGRVEIARGAGTWLKRVLDEQPDLREGLVHVWKPGVGLISGDGSVWYRIRSSEPRQWYFQYGISAALLADLSRVTGESTWLEIARRYLRASAYCYSDRYSTPQSGKIGWGAAWTFAISRDPEDAGLVDAVVRGLLALQCGDGSWNAEGVYEASPPASAASARIDVTSEFVALLSLMDAATENCA